MTNKRKSISALLDELTHKLISLNLWKNQPPSINALSSSAPFCCDTLPFEQWLQFIFIPKLTTMIDQEETLPDKISLTPMAEEAFKYLASNGKPLLEVIQQIDHTLSK